MAPHWVDRARRVGPRVLFSRPAAAVSAAGVAVIALGCMSFTFGGHYETPHEGSAEAAAESDVLTQEGSAGLKPGATLDIYYPVPYASPPNLELTGPAVSACDVLDQRADHFRVCSSAISPVVVTWKARGVRAPASPASPSAAEPPAAPAAESPAPTLAPPVPVAESRQAR